MRISKVLVIIFFGLFLSIGGNGSRIGLRGASGATSSSSSPNIVVIMTDDQNPSSLWVMPNVQKLASQGAVFANNFVSFSLCCPSRATFLTGQYAHNHGVKGNLPPEGGYGNLDHTNTLPVWLQNSGYYTAHVGKYLNGYGVQDSSTVAGEPPYEIPPGWSEWYGTLDPSTYSYFDYFINENGQINYYGSNTTDYNSDVFSRKAVFFIQRAAQSTSPFFLSVSFLAPHAGAGNLPLAPVPAPRHQGIFSNEPLPKSPSFNEKNVSDKPPGVQELPLLNEEDIANITYAYQRRLESLLAVDEAVGQMVSTLTDLGLLDNTLIFFTSDNGFLLGEHRIPSGKIFLYEESIRVPLIVSGPGVKSGVVSNELAVNVDLAPTLVEMAGASAGRLMDGRSLVPFLTGGSVSEWRSDFLLESFIPGPSYTGVRSKRWVYAEHDPSGMIREFYDLFYDRYQLFSLQDDPYYQPLIQQFHKRLLVLRQCQGQGCW